MRPLANSFPRQPSTDQVTRRPNASRLEGSTSETSAPSPLDTQDLELAAYLLARQVTGRPVDPATKALLKRANESKKEVLSMMTYGRGNVDTDLQATNNEGFHRLLAQRRVVGSISSLGEDPKITNVRDAALSAHVGSGNCGEFANVTSHVHAGRMHQRERLEMQYSENRDHSWVMVHGEPGPNGSRPRAIIDVWGEGPVIEPVDSRYLADPESTPETVHNISGVEAPELNRQFESIRRDPGCSTAKRLRALVHANAQAQKEPDPYELYSPVPFVSSQLCAAAGRAIGGRQTESTLRAEAAKLARELVPSLPREQETSVVDAIFVHAVSLDAPRARTLEASAIKHARSETNGEYEPDARRRRLEP